MLQKPYVKLILGFICVYALVIVFGCTRASYNDEVAKAKIAQLEQHAQMEASDMPKVEQRDLSIFVNYIGAKRAEAEAARAEAEAAAQAEAEAAAAEAAYYEYEYVDYGYSGGFGGPEATTLHDLVNGQGRTQGDGHTYTYYYDVYGDLDIPGEYKDADGVSYDQDGYIVVAADGYEYGDVIDTAYGQAKVYDKGSGYGNIDIYVG